MGINLTRPAQLCDGARAGLASLIHRWTRERIVRLARPPSGECMKTTVLLVALGLAYLASFCQADDAPAALSSHEIAGTVTDDDGKPIAGVLVDAWTWYKGCLLYTSPSPR